MVYASLLTLVESCPLTASAGTNGYSAQAAQVGHQQRPRELAKWRRKLADVVVDENTTLNDCFREKKDWRACKDEVSLSESVGAGPDLPSLSYAKVNGDVRRTLTATCRWKRSSSVGSGRETRTGRTRRMLEGGADGALRWSCTSAQWVYDIALRYKRLYTRMRCIIRCIASIAVRRFSMRSQ